MNWEEIVFIKSSKNRTSILETLLTEPMTVTEIAKKLNNHRSTISQQLIEMEKHGFVECLTPKRANYRIYTIKTKGKNTAKQLGISRKTHK